MRILVPCLIMCLALPMVAVGQQAPEYGAADVDVADAGQPDTAEEDAGEGRSWTQIEIVLSLAILVFALVISILQTVLMLKLDINWTPMSILRFNGLTLIIAGGLLLVTAGYSNQQIAPVSGLLGALAGYLLGSRDRGQESGGQ